MLILSFCFTRNDSAFHMSLTFFFVFLIACCINLFQSVIIGVKLEVADEFKRRVYLRDPKTNTTKQVYDDGSYIIRDDVVVGQIHFEKVAANVTTTILNTTLGGATPPGNHTIGFSDTNGTITQAKEDNTVQGRAEPITIFMSRYLFIVMCFMALIFVLMMIMLIVIFYCMSTSIKI